jgi:hypothetical protein
VPPDEELPDEEPPDEEPPDEEPPDEEPDDPEPEEPPDVAAAPFDEDSDLPESVFAALSAPPFSDPFAPLASAPARESVR